MEGLGGIKEEDPEQVDLKGSDAVPDLEGDPCLTGLSDTLKQMGAVPVVDCPEHFQDWMVSYLKSIGKLPGDYQSNPEGAVGVKGFKPDSKSVVTLSQTPKLSSFFGEADKGEASYDLWRYEVECLLVESAYPKNVIFEAVHRSLKGKAGKVASLQGPQSTIDSLLAKLASVYGSCEESESLMARFYSTKQMAEEDVSSWGCRLEDLYAKAIQSSKSSPSKTNQALRSVFWQGLKPSLKDVSGHKYDTIEDFDELRVAIRRIEFELNQRKPQECPKKPIPSKMASNSSDRDYQELKGMVQQLTSDFGAIKKQLASIPSVAQNPSPSRVRGTGISNRGSFPRPGRSNFSLLLLLHPIMLSV
ncbi:zinc finger CCHC domain-containing protein 12-like [Haliotis asinina]|uniref:zinc finger CCHC domain-containing protein 12-like n=1 Tax=Haliotis asinina TaxID=109174 RepID=UPI00353224B6